MQIIRPNVKQRQQNFARTTLKQRWQTVHRIRLEQYRAPAHLLVSWCRENIENEWSHSDACEVFYFENADDAAFFKLRWYTSTETSYED